MCLELQKHRIAMRGEARQMLGDEMRRDALGRYAKALRRGDKQIAAGAGKSAAWSGEALLCKSAATKRVATRRKAKAKPGGAEQSKSDAGQRRAMSSKSKAR